MMVLRCKKCGSEKHVKAGFIKGEQRYLCKDCGCKFVPTRQHGMPDKLKRKAIWLYCHGLSYRAIAKFCKVNVRSVFNWVKAFAQANYVKPQPSSDGVIIELDEMWHFIKKKQKNCGFGKLTAVIPISLSIGNVVIAILTRLPNYTIG
jgi:transposase